MWYVCEGALEPWNPKPIPKLWDLGQTQAPVGKHTIHGLYLTYLFYTFTCDRLEVCCSSVYWLIHMYGGSHILIPSALLLRNGGWSQWEWAQQWNLQSSCTIWGIICDFNFIYIYILYIHIYIHIICKFFWMVSQIFPGHNSQENKVGDEKLSRFHLLNTTFIYQWFSGLGFDPPLLFRNGYCKIRPYWCSLWSVVFLPC